MSSSSPPPSPSTYSVFAQRLNNSAALCIEIGQYDRAILSLQRALKLCDPRSNNANETAASSDSAASSCCTLDGCIAFSETSSLFSTTRVAAASSEVVSSSEDPTCCEVRSTKRRRIQETAEDSTSVTSISTATTSSTTASPSRTRAPLPYVYETPIRVQKQGHERIQMGSMLNLIVLFNLALAHQLKAVACLRSKNRNTTKNAEAAKLSVHKARLLYELVLNYWFKLQNKQDEQLEDQHQQQGTTIRCNNNNKRSSSIDYSSIRFRMILSNNLSQLHRLTRDAPRERECLEDLLSAILVMQVRTTTGTTPPPQAHHRNSISSLDGFLSNIASLTIYAQSAGAA